MRELLMGNEAVAAGALRAGVRVATGYPGTPSTEALEAVARRNPGTAYVEWSVNEKAALEVAAGAAYAGARALVTMKQVGLNVASDPLMSLAYVGVQGGMVVFVADDPGPISSQTEQDTRRFARFARVPVFDPQSPEEAYRMTVAAFDLSERIQGPVILRATTRVCHSCAAVEVEPAQARDVPGFERDPGRWVIFPKLSYQRKLELTRRDAELSRLFSRGVGFNRLSGEGTLGVCCGGVAAAYVEDALPGLRTPVKTLCVGTPYPFPEALAAEFLDGLTDVLVVEELDPVLEDALFACCGQRGLSVRVLGKRSGQIPAAGELTAALVGRALRLFTGEETIDPRPPQGPVSPLGMPPAVPPRPPVLCAGCPHRASFYAVKRALAGRRAVFCGDIGCYTLGNAKPLEMVDTCLCMGAGVTIAQGLTRAEPGLLAVSFVGDSTFFHSGIPGVVNALYNQTDLLLVVLDNATTAMTGRQPHPGTGVTMMGAQSAPLDIRRTLEGLGVERVAEVNPLDLDAAVAAVREAAARPGVRAIILRAPCVTLTKRPAPLRVRADACRGCGACDRELGCPALSMRAGRAAIDETLCAGCGLCARVCAFGAIGEGGDGQ